MLVATVSFSPKRWLPVLILIILNLSLWIFYYTVKLWNARFWTTFTWYKRKLNLLKPSLWICHLKMIKMYRRLGRKSSFTSAVIWWSSTLESGEWNKEWICYLIMEVWIIFVVTIKEMLHLSHISETFCSPPKWGRKTYRIQDGSQKTAEKYGWNKS